jgi:hypothetical protein
MRAFNRWFDQSPRISNSIKWLSVWLSSKRGLPVLGAIVLTVFSLIVHIVAALSGNTLVLICGFSILHIAILIGFLGVLLAEPLGRG